MSELSKMMDDVCQKICDDYCRYPREEGHEDNPDWLLEEGSPCETCPLQRISD